MDKLCQDIESDIRKLAPDGGKISPATLAEAIIGANSSLRRKLQMLAYKMHTARSQDTGQNLNLDDHKLYKG